MLLVCCCWFVEHGWLVAVVVVGWCCARGWEGLLPLYRTEKPIDKDRFNAITSGMSDWFGNAASHMKLGDGPDNMQESLGFGAYLGLKSTKSTSSGSGLQRELPDTT